MNSNGKKPITIRGITYSCSREAAFALGVTHGYVRVAKARGRLDFVGLGGDTAKNLKRFSIPTTVDGVTYASRSEASRLLNIPVHKLG